MNARQWFSAIGSGPGPRRKVAWLGGVFIVAIVGGSAYDLLRSYRTAVAEIGRELDSQAHVIAEQTARSVQAVDGVLHHVAAEFQRGRLAAHGPEQLHDFLRELTVGLKQIDGLGLFDAQGRPLAVSWPPTRAASDLAAVLPIDALRDDPKAGFSISEASRAPGDGARIVPFARRLQTASGEFAGVVAAAGRIDYFQQVYRDAYPEPSMRVALLHRDTTLLARHPPADEALGRRFPLLEQLLRQAASGVTVTRNISPLDGVERFGATRSVQDYPLVVVVTRDADAALQPWRKLAIGGAVRTLALALLAAALLAVVLRQLARLQSARASLEVSQERYALAAAGADDGIWDWDLQAGTAYESRRARELQGLPLQPETQPLDELKASLTDHPEDAAVRDAAMQAHLAGRTPAYEVEYRVRRADGSWRWIYVRALCIRDPDGRPIRLAGSVSDVDARRRAEEALRASEERYALAMTATDEGHWLWNIPAGRVYVSARLAQLFGLPGGAREMPAAEYFERIPVHADDRERLVRNRAEHVAGLTPRLDHEFRIVDAATGAVRWMHTRGQCFRDDAGQPLRLAGSTVDITQRKRAEAALRESEERFAISVAGSDDGIWVWNFVTGEAYASQRAREINGMPDAPEVQPIATWYARMAGMLHPDDVARRLAAVEAHIAGRTPAYECEYRVRAEGGGYRWLRVHGMCMRDDDGRPLRMAGSVSDIDARKRFEEALRRSEQRYQLAVDGSNEGLWDWDLPGDLLFLSPRAQRLLQADAGEPTRPRRAWLSHLSIHPDDSAAVRRGIVAHLHGRTPHVEIEFRLRRDGGEWRWYRQRGIALHDEQGRAYRMAGSLEDISARKQAEAERARLEAQLRQAQKLEAIGTLAGGIAHDFNNILAAILGYGELVQKEAGEGTRMRRHIDAAMSAGLRAKSLVERILAFSRSGTGERVTVPVQATVAEALDNLAGALPPGVQLQRRLDAADAGVLGDATQIHQVVLNLCTNAAQAMKAGGTLSVSVDTVRLDAPLTVTTTTLAAGRYVRLVVADTGSGIDARLVERIFDPFFTTKEVGVGTGLGLSLVHGIVGDLGGGIALDTAPGRGTTFTIHLPWRPWQAPAAAADDQVVPPGHGETVLLVDDEEPLVRLGEETLAGLGYEPVGFASPADALAAFRADPGRFDVVLSDEAMAGMTGLELIAEIRRLSPSMRAVLMTGFVSSAMTARAAEAGVAEVLLKPLAMRDLARCLATVFGRAPAPRGRVPETAS